MRILIVEEDDKIALFVRDGLAQAGHVAHRVPSAEAALHLVGGGDEGRFDLYIIDVMLAGARRAGLIHRLRAVQVSGPVMILSAKRTVDDRVRGLQRGGDDYLTKPFAFSELLARVAALGRRAAGAPEVTTRLAVSDLEMNLVTREVVRGGRRIDLPPREFLLLEYLLRNAGRVVSKTMIMEHVWDYNFDPMTNVVEARICKLREKVDKNAAVKLIHTVRGFGYVVRAEA
jgi:two-component system OmpR family response regulator